LRQDFGTGALVAITVAAVSFAAVASPFPNNRSLSDSISSPVRQALIYAKEGSRKLIDGRWNLSQSEDKLGIALSADEKKQLMACTGEILCEKPRDDDPGDEVPPAPITASAVSVLRPDLLVTAKHVLFKGKKALVPFGNCRFRSYLHRSTAVPVRVEKDQRRGYVFNNEDFIVLRLKRALKDCNAFAINASDSSMPEGAEVFSVTGHQRHMLNRISRREPVIAKGKIRNVFNGFFGGPPFYHADIDFDIGGSGGAAFALKDGRPVSDGEGRLILKGILVAYGLKAKNNKPYSEDRNFTIIIGLQADFMELVEGKAHEPATVEPAPCWLEPGAAKIDIISNALPPDQSNTLAPALVEFCKGQRAGEVKANCTELTKGLNLAGSQQGKEKREFRLKNDTACPVCFTYNRCNDYGCWDEMVALSGSSTLFAGIGKQAPTIKNLQFCKSGSAAMGPPLPPRKPVLARMTPSPPLQPSTPERTPTIGTSSRGYAVGPAAKFAAAQEKAEREGVHALTSDDIRGLSLDQIRELRGY